MKRMFSASPTFTGPSPTFTGLESHTRGGRPSSAPTPEGLPKPANGHCAFTNDATVIVAGHTSSGNGPLKV